MSVPHSQLTVLIVSQDAFKNTVLKQALKGVFNLIEAKNGFSAIDKLKGMQVEVVILDKLCGEMTWSELCEHIRKLDGYLQTPILLINNDHKKSFLLQALKHGISDFINEPLDVNEIYQCVLTAIQTKPVNKKIALVSHKIKKRFNYQSAKATFVDRLITTEEAIKEISKINNLCCGSLSPASKIQNRIDTIDSELVKSKFQLNQECRPLCLVMLEIDRLNKMREALPEDVLKNLFNAVHSFLSKHLRKLDVLMPQGGGRFLLLLPKTSRRAGMMIAELIHSEAPVTKFLLNDREVCLTFSIGLTVYDDKSPPSESTYELFEELIKQANSALKEARQKGNRIIRPLA